MSTRVAVIGYGWATRTIWLPRLDAHPGWKVTAVVDADPQARAAAAADRPDTLVLTRPGELEPGTADLAVVAVPNHAHTTVAGELLSKGIPVFLEKPVCLSSAEADDLAAAEKEGDAVLVAGSAARHRGDVRALAHLLPAIGDIRHVRLAWVRARGVPGTGWFTRRSHAGGGALVDLGWHLLDTVLPMLGVVEFDQVAGTIGTDFINRAAARAVWKADGPDESTAGDAGDAGDVEDTARAFLVTEDGVSVSLHVSWASHAAHDTTLIEVTGTTGIGTLRCTFGFSPDRQGSSLTLTQDGNVVSVPLAEEPVGAEYDRQIDELPALLTDPLGQGKAVDEARRTIDVIERVYAAALSTRGGSGLGDWNGH